MLEDADFLALMAGATPRPGRDRSRRPTPLLDLRPHLAKGGFGHGLVHAWSARGRLLATASQTAVLRRFGLSLLRKFRR